MKKYTVKELAQIEGDHDPVHCDSPGCPICKAFYAYSMKLRTQTEIIERVEKRQKVSTIAAALCLSEDFVKATVAAYTNGSTISAYQVKGYESMLSEMVVQGYSINAIARYLRKPTSTVRGYFNANGIKKPASKKITIEVITTNTGEVRYFDRKGMEYVLEKKHVKTKKYRPSFQTVTS